MSLLEIKKRIAIIFVLFAVLLCLLIVRIGYWQIIRGGDMQAAVTEQQNRKVTVTAPRGSIYDRNGKALAESATVNTLICNPQTVRDLEKADNGITGVSEILSEELSVILNMDYEKIHTLLNKSNRYQVIKKRLSIEESEQIKAIKNPDDKDDEEKQKLKKVFSAISFEEDSKRYYSYNIAPHIMGFTGYDNNGLQGIELTFDDELSGKNGGILNLQTASGTATAELEQEEYIAAQKGADIVLTIDETIQHFLESSLEAAISEHQLKEGAAGIVMNPKTGEILAMATKPDFDLNEPNDTTQFEKSAIDFEYQSKILGRTVTSKENKLLAIGQGNRIKIDTDDSDKDNLSDDDAIDAAYNEKIGKNNDGLKLGTEDENEDDSVVETAVGYLTEDKLEELYSERTAAIRNKMWRNKAISDAYEPGSTFKIVTAAAALEEGVVNMDSPFVCGGYKQIGKYKIGCHKSGGHGAQTFFEGVLHSCNPVFMETGLALGSDKFMEYFSAFGLTEKTGIELIGESGSIYYKNKKLSDTDLATSSFGQGFNVTPIQMITAVSAVVNGGNLMKPQIVKEIRNETGIIKSYQPEVVNKVISEETSRMMRQVLEQVVAAPNGTGRNAYIKGYRIGGKTGTSEKGDRSGNKRIASFIGFAPADDPQIVCLVMLDEPQVANKFGGTIAAPMAGEIIEDTLEYLGVARNYEEEETNKTIETPDYRSIPTEDARQEAKSLGFNVKVSGDGQMVVDQLPKPGVMLTEGSTIILYTEEDYEVGTVTVPDVTGLTLDGARSVIKKLNLNFEAIGAGQNTAQGAYAVKQSVEPGTEVTPATVIGVEFRQQSSD